MPAGVKRGEVRRDGRVVRWVESGRGEPVVVLDAAAAEPGPLAWAGVMPLVAAHTRVVAYDRAGNGDSDPVTPLSLDAQTGDRSSSSAGPSEHRWPCRSSCSAQQPASRNRTETGTPPSTPL
jgi:hypothetical protein